MTRRLRRGGAEYAPRATPQMLMSGGCACAAQRSALQRREAR